MHCIMMAFHKGISYVRLVIFCRAPCTAILVFFDDRLGHVGSSTGRTGPGHSYCLA